MVSSRESQASPLRRRELAVVELLATGLQNKEVAAQLRISPATVRVYVSTCLLKCGVATRTALAGWYLRREAGLVRTKAMDPPDAERAGASGVARGPCRLP